MGAGAVVLLFALGYWRGAGFIGPSRWRQLGLIWLPLSLLGGLQPLDAGTIAVFVVGYLATGFFEESMFRGVILGFLRPLGVWRAVLICSALFGSLHLTRLFFGSAPATVTWQVFFAFCFGVAFCALRLRTGTIWPLILLHALWDFTLNAAHLPMVLYPLEYLALLAFGVFLLRGGVALAPVTDVEEEEMVEAPATPHAAEVHAG